jgi:hypothetical protein
VAAAELVQPARQAPRVADFAEHRPDQGFASGDVEPRQFHAARLVLQCLERLARDRSRTGAARARDEQAVAPGVAGQRCQERGGVVIGGLRIVDG